MKNYQKGFVVPLVVAIVSLLGIGGGIYYFFSIKNISNTSNHIIVNNIDLVSPTDNVATTTTEDSKVPIPKMDAQNIQESKVRENTAPALKDCIPTVVIKPGEIDLQKASIGITTNANTSYYEVFGYNQKDIYGQIIKCGPYGGNIISEDRDSGDTFTYTNFSYDYKQKSGSCETSNVKVGLNIKYYLPKWTAMPEATAMTQEMWNIFFKLLLDHENHHGELAKANAQKLLDYLQKPDTADCSKITPRGEEILAELQDEQDRFDEETDHGWNQYKLFFKEEDFY